MSISSQDDTMTSIRRSYYTFKREGGAGFLELDDIFCF